MFFRFEAEVPLRWADVDSAGVVNNAVFLSLIEQGRFAYFEHLGLIADHRVPFLLAETSIRFLRPGRLGMRIQVAAATTQLGGTSFAMEYEVRAANEVLATATAALVFVGEDLRPRAIPPEVRAAIEQFEELGAG